MLVILAGHDTSVRVIFHAGAASGEPVLPPEHGRFLMVRSGQWIPRCSVSIRLTCELTVSRGYNPGMQWLASGVPRMGNTKTAVDAGKRHGKR